MAKLTVHAGDWLKGGQHSFSFGSFALYSPGKFMPEGIHSSQLEEVQVASEEAVKKIGGAVGWGTVGALALGPVGLLAGVILGGNKKEVTFVARFKDGRKLLATVDNKSFIQMQAAVF